jgi:hypothetical protein
LPPVGGYYATGILLFYNTRKFVETQEGRSPPNATKHPKNRHFPHIDQTPEKCYSNPMANKDLKNAAKAKQDEFYTQITDIEKECRHYADHFKGKTIFCNCDDPYESEFFKYFALSFNVLGSKKLIATCYAGSPIANTQMSLFDHESEENKTTRRPHKIIINEAIDENKDGAFDLRDIVASLAKNKKNTLTRLNGDGDFRSQECIEILKEADIVVTNPPFSLFREYVAQLMEYEKQFLIIGNINAITYKEVFPLIKENKIWLGISIHSGDREFKIPPHYEVRSKSLRINENGERYIRVSGVRWLTNLDYKQRHEDLFLYRKYNENDHPKYDNYNAIEVSAVTDIPVDYEGFMGVPITFIDKYNPDQFEIIGLANDKREKNDAFIQAEPYNLDEQHKNFVGFVLNGKATYARILIKRKK